MDGIGGEKVARPQFRSTSMGVSCIESLFCEIQKSLLTKKAIYMSQFKT
jgi:hypothetical protein